MFKKLLKKTKYFIGAAGVSAVAVFPVAFALNPSQVNLKTSVSQNSTITTQQVFTQNDGTVNATPDKVVDTSKLSSSNFLNISNAELLFKKGNTDAALNKFISNKGNEFDKETLTSSSRGQLGLQELDGNYNAQTYAKYYGDDHKLALYKTLNPEMAKTLTGKGTRFDFSIPKQFADIASLTQGQTDLQTKTWDINRDGAFIYKVAQIDPSNIKGTLAIDYMYDTGVANSTPKKTQIIINASDDLASDQVSLDEIINKKEIFLRTLDNTKTPSSLATQMINFSNSGITLVKKEGKLYIYSSLQTINAKSSIMVDPITNIDSDAKAATIGVVDADSSAKPKGIKIPTASKDVSVVSNFKQFAIENDWTDVPNYKWLDGKSTSAQQMEFYMKSDSELSNILLQSSFIKNAGTLTITASGKEGKVTISPNDAYQIKPVDFVDGAKLFEVSYMKKTVAGSGDWFKVTITVENSVGKQDYFLINNHPQSTGSGENPWAMTDSQKKSPIFFRNPFTANFTGQPVVLTRKMQKLIDSNAIEEQAYKYVYGSWETPTPKALVPTDVAKTINDNLGVGVSQEPYTY